MNADEVPALGPAENLLMARLSTCLFTQIGFKELHDFVGGIGRFADQFKAHFIRRESLAYQLDVLDHCSAGIFRQIQRRFDFFGRRLLSFRRLRDRRLGLGIHRRMDLTRIGGGRTAATNHDKREERENLMHSPVYCDARFGGGCLPPKSESTYR